MDRIPSVIILDDDKNLRKTIGDILRIKGFHPIPLRLGQEAVERTRREEIAVALIDLRLEDMPGLEVLRLIREGSPSTACILLTGNASQASAIEAINLGAYSYYQKPFDIDQLLLSIRHAVERRAAARALSESQARYHTFINATADMAFLKDDQFRYVIVNEANARFFGKPIPEVIGRDDFDLMKKETAQACRESDRRALEENGSVTTVEEVDGRFYETRKFPVPLQDGRTGVGGYIRDVTDKLKGEEALQESEGHYRGLFEDSPISLWEEDFSAVKKRLESLRKRGVKDFASYLKSHPQVAAECAALVRVLNVNKATLDLYGARSKEELLKNLSIIFNEESLESFRSELTAVAEGKTQFQWEGMNLTLDRKRLVVNLSWSAAPGHEIDLSRVIVSIVDITERKRAERDLQEAESKLRAIVEQVPAIVYTEEADDPRTTLYINPQIETLTGYSPAEWIGEQDFWKKVIHSDDQHRVVAEDERTTRTGEPFRVEYRILARDGRTLWVRDEAVLVRDAHGRPLFWQGIMHDITERKQAEQALHESEQRYQTLAEVSPAGIFRTDADGLTTYVNRRWCEISGMEAEAALGNGWLEAVHPDDRARLAAGWQEAVGRQNISTSDYRFLKPDGSIAWVIGQALPERDVQGEIVGYVGAITNITARKQAEEDLRLSEERYRMLAENMSDTVWLMDLDLRTVYISPSVTKLRGYTLEELNAIPLDRQMGPDSLRKALGLFVEILSPETLAQSDQPIARRAELEFYRKDGTSFWSENTFTLIRNPDGTPRMILGSGRDISERKQAQEALENSEKRFRSLIENSADIIILLDPRGKELYHSPAYWKVTGRNPRDRLGRNFLENIHPDDQPEATKAFNEVLLRPGQSRSLAFRSLHRDGGWRWLEATVSNLLGEPSVQSIVLNLRDVTERWQAEQDLSRRAAELEVLYENGLAISGLLDVQEICQRLISVIEAKMQWHHLAVRLLDPDTNTVRVAAFNHPGLSEEEKSATIERLNKKISKAGEGLSGWVIQHGQPVRSGNVLADERYVRSFPGIRSGLYVPLKAGNRTIGAIAVESTEPDTFTEQDERLLITVAAQAAVAIENARSYQKALHSAHRSAALHQAGLEIVRAGNNLEAIYAALHHAVGDVMPAEGFTLSFLDEARGEIRGVYLIENGGRLPGTVWPLDGLNGHVIKTGKSLRVGNMKREKRFKFAVVGSDETPCSYLAVPLLAAGKTIGVVSAQSYLPNQYSAEDQALLETLASEAIIAIENARLWAATNRHVEELSALAQISSSLRSATTHTEMIPVILEQVGKVLHAKDAALLTYDPVTGENIVEMALGGWSKLIRYRFQPGEGLVSSIARTHLPYRSSDITQDESLIFHDVIQKPEAAIGIPLLVQKLMIGSLWVGRPQAEGQDAPTPFTDDEMRMLGSIADITANAIHRARLHEQALRHTEQMLTVIEAGRLLSETLNLKQIYTRLTGAIHDLLPDTSGLFVFFYNQRARSIHCASGYVDGYFMDVKELPSLSLDPEGNDPWSRTILNGEPLIANDLAAAPAKALWMALPGAGSREPKSALYVPIFFKGNTTGLIEVQSYTPNLFGQEDLSMLALVANTAAATIENARLFDETQRRLRYISTLHNIDAAINASVDLRVTLNIILENITKEFGVDAAALLLANPHSQTLEYSASRGFRSTLVEGMRLRLGEGLAGKAALQRQLISLADAGTAAPDIFENEKFVSQYAIPLVAKGQVQGVLQVCHRSPIEPDPEWAGFLTTLAGQAAIALDNSRLFETLQRSNLDLMLAYDATIQGWSNALDMRDKETEGHSQRVTELTVNLAIAMGARDTEIEHIRRGALLHDIGKLGIPDAILLKPAALTPEEWDIMRKHPVYAYDLLNPIEYLHPALDIPYCHHEKWDGSGYPRRLAGEQIPLAARIFAVADVWDALTSDRPYRPAWSKAQALKYIREQAGKHFDPAVVEVFMMVHK